MFDVKEYEQRPEIKTKRREQAQKYREKNKNNQEYKNRVKNYNKYYYEEHKDYYKKHAEEYRKKHRDELVSDSKRWYYDNQERAKANTRKYYREHREHCLNHAIQYQEKIYSIPERREKILMRNKKYRKTFNGKKNHAKQSYFRKRRLGFNELFPNEIDELFVWHHIDNNNVVAIPRDIHELYGCGHDAEVHRENLSYIVKQLYP